MASRWPLPRWTRGNQTLASIATGLNSTWMSGSSRPSRVFRNAMALIGSREIGPVPNSAHWMADRASRSNLSWDSKAIGPLAA